ncbi:MAG: ring-cleaving dioxygenase [Hyphomicrobiales bacterium]|nr:ring-cleaving dioxygenase [Hyphomicrobiales bacterium]
MMTTGIHHVTAIASDPKRNVDFYTRLLGLRLVKKTVNFDDPTTYHLYYADAAGSPGSVMTFFPHPFARKGRHGAGQAVEVSFAAPHDALPFWIDRLARMGVAHSAAERFGEKLVRFEDPDGLPLEIVAVDGVAGAGEPWETEGVTKSEALRGFHSVTLWEQNHEATAQLLSDHFGFKFAGSEGERVRFRAESEGVGRIVDIRRMPEQMRGSLGAGVNHHIAFRARDDDHQAEMREALTAEGFNVTPMLDRNYFHSVYFREPGGVLFEIATDPPGFAADESLESLGRSLKLPPQYEPRRAEIEAALPPLGDAS